MLRPMDRRTFLGTAALVGAGTLVAPPAPPASAAQVPEQKGAEGVRGTGLRHYEPDRCYSGYTLFAPDHGERVYLIDLTGAIVHEWRVPNVHFAMLLDNHHLLHDTQFADDHPPGVRECDWEGNEVWFYECPVHHDAQRLANGNTILLAHETVTNLAVYRGTITKNTKVVEVTADGELVWEWHSDRHIDELKRLVGVNFPRRQMDWTHTNAVQSLPDTPAGRRDERFKAGNVLISHRNLSTIAVIARESGQIVWAWGPGDLDYQHMPIMLPSGNILIFDNGPHRRYSRVVELDPLAGRIVWQFTDDPPEAMHAGYLSGAQRLPNGNTFICAGGTKDGRLLEVTSSGDVVWDFRNPWAARAKGRTKVYRAYRYAAEFIERRL